MSDTSDNCYPVLDNSGKPIGSITLNEIRNAISNQEMNDWLIAMDVMKPVEEFIDSSAPLTIAFEKMKTLGQDHLLVCNKQKGYLGILDHRSANRRIEAEVLAKQKEADAMYELRAGI